MHEAHAVAGRQPPHPRRAAHVELAAAHRSDGWRAGPSGASASSSAATGAPVTSRSSRCRRRAAPAPPRHRPGRARCRRGRVVRVDAESLRRCRSSAGIGHAPGLVRSTARSMAYCSVVAQVRLEHITKTVRRGVGGGDGSRRRDHRRRRPRVHDPARAVGVREEHAAADGRRARGPDQRATSSSATGRSTT